jgi:hypothetical protein
MAKVEVTFEEVELQGEHRTVDGVEATCSKCDHTTESFGTGAASRRRCPALLREGCPENLENHDVDPDAGAGPAPRRRGGFTPEGPRG